MTVQELIDKLNTHTRSDAPVTLEIWDERNKRYIECRVSDVLIDMEGTFKQSVLICGDLI